MSSDKCYCGLEDDKCNCGLKPKEESMFDKKLKESALATVEMAHETVRLRINAGDHPEDAMMAAWQIMESWVRVYVDGRWSSKNK